MRQPGAWLPGSGSRIIPGNAIRENQAIGRIPLRRSRTPTGPQADGPEPTGGCHPSSPSPVTRVPLLFRKRQLDLETPGALDIQTHLLLRGNSWRGDLREKRNLRRTGYRPVRCRVHPRELPLLREPPLPGRAHPRGFPGEGAAPKTSGAPSERCFRPVRSGARRHLRASHRLHRIPAVRRTRNPLLPRHPPGWPRTRPSSR